MPPSAAGVTSESPVDPLSPNSEPGASNEQMAARIREFDWSATPLGPRDQWPQSLRSAVSTLLSSRYAMWMAWGSELSFIYNDAYSPTLGIKHPWALGQPASTVWKEIWTDIGPRIQTVLSSGKATWDEGLLLFLERSEFREETYHTFSYSPLWNEQGGIGGMLCVVTEETDRVIGERRVETLRELASALTKVATEPEAIDTIRDVLGRNPKDLPFTLTYLYEGETDSQDAPDAMLACSTGVGPQHQLAPARIEASTDQPWPARTILHERKTEVVSLEAIDASDRPRGQFWNEPCGQAVVVPIRRQGQEQPAGFFVAGVNPFRRLDTDYSGFVDLLSGQIAAALGNARAWEAERRRAQALAEIDRAKTTFFSNVSHELRTPLTLMLSPVEQLLGDVDEEDHARREMLELVHRNGLRLQKLVNSLLDFARIEAGRMQAEFEPVDLAEATKDLAANFRSALQRAGIRYIVDCPPLETPVYVNREMWEKIVLNLISNAFKFTLEGEVRITVRAREHHAVLEVADTGTGIPGQELPNIFERFHRVESARGRSIEGTGIGLALVLELVKLHGGSISVDSVIGRGSTFTVSLPMGSAHLPVAKVKKNSLVHKERAASETAPASRAQTFVEEALRWLPPEIAPSELEESAPTETAGQIVLADDNGDMRAYVAGLLGRRYRVTSVASGEEALQAALDNPPDLILSDVMMPGMGGFGLLAELRKHPSTQTVPVILLSARAGEESRVDGLAAGADDYLIKPFTARELLARVSAHMAMKRRREEAERAVRESQITLQSFYDSSPFLMGIAELEGEEIIAIYGNRAMAAFLEVPHDLLAGRTGSEIGVPSAADRMWIEQYRRSQREGKPVSFEYEHPREDGNRWVSATATYLGPGPSGRPRFSFVAEDITEKKHADDLLRRSNEELRRVNSDLEQFAYSASHDLQEPLRQVAVYSQLLQRRYSDKLDQKALEYLGWCVQGAHRMEMLVRDILAYSQAGRTTAAAEQPVNLNDIVEEVRRNLATAFEESGGSMSVSPLPHLKIDSVPLTQLFQNLISNALKYRSERPPHINIKAQPDGPMWKFAVEDNGIGIAPEFRTQIFGLFKRLHNWGTYPGTGIGLAICQRIVERYGGRMWVEAADGGGSRFVFTLPEAPQ